MSVCEIGAAPFGGARALLPVTLDLSRLTVAVVGRGLGALQRLELLDAARAEQVTVYADSASGILQVKAGGRLVPRLPTAAELAAADVLFLTDLDPAEAQPLAERAHAAGALVNIADGRGGCGFLPVDGDRPVLARAAAPAAAGAAADDPTWGLPAHIWAF